MDLVLMSLLYMALVVIYRLIGTAIFNYVIVKEPHDDRE